MIHLMEDPELRASLEAPDRHELITEWVRERTQLKDQSQIPSGPKSPDFLETTNLKGAIQDT